MSHTSLATQQTVYRKNAILIRNYTFFVNGLSFLAWPALLALYGIVTLRLGGQRPCAQGVPADLPGDQPTAELPARSPGPSDTFGRLHTRTQVRRYSGRTADACGGILYMLEAFFIGAI